MTDFTNAPVAAETAEFTLSLAKAHTITERIDNLINKANRDVSASAIGKVTRTEWADPDLIFQKFDDSNQRVMEGLGFIIRATTVRGNIRAKIGNANSEAGIGDRLAEITSLQSINKRLEQLDMGIAGHQGRESLDAAVKFFNENESTDANYSYFAVLIKEQVDNLNEIQRLNLNQIQRLKDEISELNHTTKITVEIDTDIAEMVGLQ